MSEVIQEKIIEVSDEQDLAPIVRVKKIDDLGRSYATGKRKNAIAKVWIKKGTGKMVINSRVPLQYFGREILVNIAKAPFGAVKAEDKFDVTATIIGGGKSGQAGALAHGISKALVAFDPEANHKSLRDGEFLTRDSRVVERKKPGLKKARKAQTYRKR